VLNETGQSASKFISLWGLNRKEIVQKEFLQVTIVTFYGI